MLVQDPVIFIEYAKDVAAAAKKRGIKTVAVTAGYINGGAPREDFYSFIDAANVDLKAFSDDFYKKITGGKLQPVLDTLVYLKNETNVWFEITTLLIPGQNDSAEEIDKMSKWIVKNIGCEVPLHFSAFHPDFKMMDLPRTPLETLIMARDIAIKNGINYVYTGNVHHEEGDSTYCSNCKKKVISRDWYEMGEWNLNASGKCLNCQHQLPGAFDGPPGTWGAQRLPVSIF